MAAWRIRRCDGIWLWGQERDGRPPRELVMADAYPKSAMRGRRSAKAFPFLPAAAFAGVVVAHGLTYLAAFPQSLLRRQVLAETGHSYWAAAVALAVVFAAVSAITTIAEHIGRGIRHERPQSAGHRYRGAL